MESNCSGFSVSDVSSGHNTCEWGGMLTASYGIAASAADTEIIDSGSLSDGRVSWTLDSEGLLYISGEGEIPDSWLFDWWYNDEDKYITKIVFDENCAISRIGEHALSNTDSTDIIINTTVPLTIGEGAIDTFSDRLNITVNAPGLLRSDLILSMP